MCKYCENALEEVPIRFCPFCGEMITPTKYLIERCKICERYNHKEGRPRNKLYCMLKCEEYKQDQAARAFAYNRAVSGEDFDTEVLYEHGKKVYGSGWKDGKE